jgi:glucose-6-phosphate 1-dehydrogenase
VISWFQAFAFKCNLRRYNPALFALFVHNHLPPRTTILGYARSNMDNDSLRAQLRGYLKGDASRVAAFLEICFYEPGQYSRGDNAAPEELVFGKMAERIREFEVQRCGEKVVGHRIFYLALPPSVYPPVCGNIKAAGMSHRGWTRVIVEKPFGKDLESSEELNAGIAELFTEAEVYRIDHYLGKELTQNLVVMRFANRFLAPLWWGAVYKL